MGIIGLNLGLILGVVLLLSVLYIILGPISIGSDKVGLVEKRFSTKTLKNGEFIALNGESGIQPEVLRAGLHFKNKIFYKIHKMPLVTIKQGQIGYIFSRSGQSLKTDQLLGKEVDCNNFQDVRAFLSNEGQKGPQRQILREGTYAINLAQFVVITQNKTYLLSMGDREEQKDIEQMSTLLKKRNGFTPVIISNDQSEKFIPETGELVKTKARDIMGIIVTYEGVSLPQGELIAPIVGQDIEDKETYHNSFQNIEKFLNAGGCQGRQHQVLTEGTYMINRLFASVEFIDKTYIDNSEAGVVISYIGAKGEDLSGEDYTHGELVANGCKGIWKNALQAGKYAFNIYSGKIIIVPTDNFSLKWVDNETSVYSYDKHLRCLSVITKDGFKPKLPLSVLVHIDYRKAPLVIQRFGSIEKLVEQTLDTIISAHFKQIAESKTFLELVQNKAEIAREAKEKMSLEFKKFNLDLEEVLIDTPLANGDQRVEQLIEQLATRELASEKVKTYESEMKASITERELKELQAKTNQQEELTQSSIQIEIIENKAEADKKKAQKDSEKLKIETDAIYYKNQKEVELKAYQVGKEAEAESNKLRVLSKAEADKTIIISEAEAKSIKTVAEAEAFKENEVGLARAKANEKLVNSYGGAEIMVKKEVMIAFAKAIEEGKIDIVPKNLIMSGDGKNVNPFENYMSLLLTDKLDNLNEELSKNDLSAKNVDKNDLSAKNVDKNDLSEKNVDDFLI